MSRIWLGRLGRFAWATALNFTWASITVAGVTLVCAWWFGADKVFGAGMEATLRPFILSLPLVAVVMTVAGMLERPGKGREDGDDG